MQGIRFRIQFERGVKEQLKKFPKNIQQRISDAISKRLTIAPNDYGKALTKEWKEHRRLRVGDYRVIYKVYDQEVVVFIVQIDHRKLVYGLNH